jgi:hypothetical protein
VVASAAAPGTKPPAPAAAASPAAQVKLTLGSTPPGVKVTNNGQPIGVTPMEYVTPAGQPVKLRFSMPGFTSQTKAFTPKVDGTLDVELQPAAPAAPPTEELKDVY